MTLVDWFWYWCSVNFKCEFFLFVKNQEKDREEIVEQLYCQWILNENREEMFEY